jgi:hypothetical protein
MPKVGLENFKTNNSAHPFFQSFINFSAVADGYDDDDEPSFLYFVDDPVLHFFSQVDNLLPRNPRGGLV